MSAVINVYVTAVLNGITTFLHLQPIVCGTKLKKTKSARHEKRQREKDNERDIQIKKKRLGEVEGWRKTGGGRLSGSEACWAGSQG